MKTTATMRHRPFSLKRLLPVLATLLWVMGGAVASAHEIRPAIVDLSFTEDGFRAEISLNLEALVADIGPGHGDTSQSDRADVYNGLRLLPSAALFAAFMAEQSRILDGVAVKADGRRLATQVLYVDIPDVGDPSLARISTLAIGGALPSGVKALTWSWSADFGASAVRVRGPATDGEAGEKGEVVFSAYLRGGKESAPIALEGIVPQSPLALAADYIAVGFTHIVPKGLDHILFVVGLFLLNARLSSLMWQVSSFTVAHTATLAMGMLGVIAIPPAIVEPLIAASIVYVGVENVLTDKLHRWRPVVVFGFGLLHGLGFAGVLAEIGVRADQFLLGLISFNVGVELGQLAVIALCFLAVGLWFRRRDWYHARVTVPGSVLISLLGAWWFVERTFL